MKPLMMISIVILTAIVIATSFGLSMGPSTPIQIPAALQGTELYVCPATSQAWMTVANSLHQFKRGITIIFFFATIVLMFVWGWTLYQNLLDDKFKRESFSNVWKFTKMLFWAGVVVIIAMATPNHFKTVHITGANGNWVLCENNTPGAQAVRANAVRP